MDFAIPALPRKPAAIAAGGGPICRLTAPRAPQHYGKLSQLPLLTRAAAQAVSGRPLMKRVGNSGQESNPKFAGGKTFDIEEQNLSRASPRKTQGDTGKARESLSESPSNFHQAATVYILGGGQGEAAAAQPTLRTQVGFALLSFGFLTLFIGLFLRSLRQRP